MNTSIAIAAPVLVALLWLFTRRQPQLRRAGPGNGTTAASASVPALIQQSVSSLAPQEATSDAPEGDMLHPPVGSRARHQRLATAVAALTAEPVQRQLTMQQLGRWGDRAVLPLLKRGLRDPHPQVVLAAAQAMERFRGRTAAGSSAAFMATPSLQRLPRNGRPQA